MEHQNPVAKTLISFVTEAIRIEADYDVKRWALIVSSFLGAAGYLNERDNFDSLTADNVWDVHALRIGYLQGLVAKFEMMATQPTSGDSESNRIETSTNLLIADSHKVFVVHGHDNELKEVTARFLERLGLQAIVLHERPKFRKNNN